MPDKLPVSFTSKDVTHTHQYAHLHGYRFELYDTIETLEAVNDGPIQIDQAVADMLMRIDVIKSNGSRRSLIGATKGENFDAFLKALNDRVERLG